MIQLLPSFPSRLLVLPLSRKRKRKLFLNLKSHKRGKERDHPIELPSSETLKYVTCPSSGYGRFE